MGVIKVNKNIWAKSLIIDYRWKWWHMLKWNTLCLIHFTRTIIRYKFEVMLESGNWIYFLSNQTNFLFSNFLKLYKWRASFKQKWAPGRNRPKKPFLSCKQWNSPGFQMKLLSLASSIQLLETLMKIISIFSRRSTNWI